jgi:hypothetical protein
VDRKPRNIIDFFPFKLLSSVPPVKNPDSVLKHASTFSLLIHNAQSLVSVPYIKHAVQKASPKASKKTAPSDGLQATHFHSMDEKRTAN